MGLPSHKSLFQVQAERLQRVQQLAATACGSSGAAVPLRWYIMTSQFTHDDTVSHFEKNGYFGLSKDQIMFFQQGFLPCLTESGEAMRQP